jgi:hypothetical protein
MYNDTGYCVTQPYNIRLRAACPAGVKPTYPVTIVLRTKAGTVVRRQKEFVETYLLWGNDRNKTTAALDPASLLSPQKLAKGAYTLTSAMGGLLRFRQIC